MLTIENHKKLLGTKLKSKDSTEWQVVSIESLCNVFRNE
jgi:hypothetical protein